MIRRLIAALIFLILSGTVLAQTEPKGPSLSLTDFQAQIAQLDVQVADLEQRPQEAEGLRNSLPKHWTVTGGNMPVEVSASFLDQALTDFQKQGPEQKKITLKEVHTRLAMMRDGVDGFMQPDAVNDAMRKRLADILAAREFSSVHGPSLLDTWIEAAEAWLKKWWDKLFGALDINPPDFTWVGRIFVWLVIAAAASVFALWLYRLYRRKPTEFHREVIPFAPSSKSWRVWLTEAQAHAEKGEWREAIHLSYWAGVSYLEASRLWIPDRARTPREYLREVNNHDPKKAPFTSLTRRFESVWYGSRRGHADDFDAALTELEKLGCR